MDIKHIYWLAALLDGEGWFGYQVSPCITISQIDLDIVEKAKNIIGDCPPIKTYHSNNPKHKTHYTLTIHGIRSISWMMTVYSLMSVRRKSQIRDVISKWRDQKYRSKGSDYCSKGHPLLKEGVDYYSQTTPTGNITKVCKICSLKRSSVRYNRKALKKQLGLTEEQIKELLTFDNKDIIQ